MDITRRTLITSLAALPLASHATAQEALPEWQTKLIKAARAQIGITRYYDGAYVRLSYPGGDVNPARGVCTDVIVRAYRAAFDFDLQKEVHEDMRGHFSVYPKIWGLTRPDKNIDHRRVPNLEAWLRRHGEELDVPTDARDWQPGDLYTMRIANLPHIAIISDRKTWFGRPYVLHNIGRGTAEDDIIGRYDDERRFRFAPPIDAA